LLSDLDCQASQAQNAALLLALLSPLLDAALDVCLLVGHGLGSGPNGEWTPQPAGRFARNTNPTR
jgi:hypothetical protein